MARATTKAKKTAAKPESGSRAGVSLTNPELERAIEEAPDDPASYLVYRDWLLSHGDPRGELMLIQMQLAERSTFALQRAEEALFDRFAQELLGPHLVGKLDDLEWRFGFIRRATFFRGSPTTVRAVLNHPSGRFLEALAVNGYPADDALIEVHGRVRLSLRHLDLSPPSTGRKATLSQALFDHVPNLEVLALGFELDIEPSRSDRLLRLTFDGPVAAARMHLLTRLDFPRLEYLRFAALHAKADWWQALRLLLESSHWPRVETLSLELHAGGLEHLPSVVAARKLRCLELSGLEPENLLGSPASSGSLSDISEVIIRIRRGMHPAVRTAIKQLIPNATFVVSP